MDKERAEEDIAQMDDQAGIEHSNAPVDAQEDTQTQERCAQTEDDAEANSDEEVQSQIQTQAQLQPPEEPGAPAVIPRPEERKRVKVYELRASDWHDRGTGMCYADTNEAEPMIYVESEETPGTMLLQSKVMKKDVYQKQQDTLIVWTDLSGTDMALSFQEAEGCASIWNFVTTVQTYFQNSQDDSVSEDAREGVLIPLLPLPTLDNLPDIERIFQIADNTIHNRDMLVKYLLQEDYMSKLVPLVTEAETYESLPHLHRLCNIMKMIILLNDNAIVEALVDDEIVEGVVGALEYDPEFSTHKANHRQYLRDRSRYKEVVPIEDPMIRHKIRCTWRLQYLKDVVLARIIDDPTFSILNSLIFFNQVTIVQHLQHNTTFLQDLFALFRVDNNDPQNMRRKEDALRFLYQCTTVAKTLQPPARNALYVDFVDHGVFDAIAFALSHPTSTYRATGVDILMSFLDHDQGTMREYMLLFKRGSLQRSDLEPREDQGRAQEEDEPEPQEDKPQAANPESQETQYFDTRESSQEPNEGSQYEPQHLLTDTLIDLLHIEPDLGVKMQISDSLKILLEPVWFFGDSYGLPLTADDIRQVRRAETLKPGVPGSAGTDSRLDALIMRRRFDVSMIRLFAPLKKLKDMDLSELTFQEAAAHEHLLDILSCFLRSHVQWGKRFIYCQQLIPRIAQILDAPQEHLKLAALQTFRTLIHVNDTFYFGEMSRNDVYGKLLKIIIDTIPRDSLLNSTCLEFFESITRQTANKDGSLRPVIFHLGANHRNTLERLTEMDTFRKILIKYDQMLGFAPSLNMAYLTSDDTDIADTDIENGVRRPRVIAGGQIGYQGLSEDREQDDYLEAMDDDDDGFEAQGQADQADLTLLHGHPAPTVSPSPSTKPLVDYPDDDDEDEQEEAQDEQQGEEQLQRELEQSTEQASSPLGTPSTSPQSRSQENQGSVGTPTTSPALAAVTQEEQLAAIARGLAEKRRREEDDDDELMKLSGNARKRAASGTDAISSQGDVQQGSNSNATTSQISIGKAPRKGISFSSLGSWFTGNNAFNSAKRRNESTDEESDGGVHKKIQLNQPEDQSVLDSSIERREDDDDDEHADESATAEPLTSESDEENVTEGKSISPSSQDAVRRMEESIAAAGGELPK